MKDDMVVNQINSYIDDYTTELRTDLNAVKSLHDNNNGDRCETADRLDRIFSTFLSEKTDNGIITINSSNVIDLEVRLSLNVTFVKTVFFDIEFDIIPNEIIIKKDDF